MMTTEFESKLTSVPPEQWRVKRLEIVGWYDGPLEGLCELDSPSCTFYFELWAERLMADDVDDRLFRLSTLPEAIVEEMWQFLSTEPAAYSTGFSQQVWAEQKQRLDAWLATRTLSNLIVQTWDWKQFLRYWHIVPQRPDRQL
jgi:hypothetical protein